ncbi:putative pre-rRNA-processing protein TSR2 [Medicago truncatula]|uniref:Putative pre-rRNA-processing protein TSR2 n=1 Tax=Medicago truncatula TaxID=3880 RepID=A0A396HPP1_MEDTR|nr:putative pre-rRNA-processing protein TSR2 [Medicago truncatula]
MYIYNIHFLSFLSHSLCDVWTTHIERKRVLLMMDTINRETETLSRIRLQESIILLLSRWYALQMAIKNQWGGCDSLQKSHQLASHLFSWLSKSNAPIRIEDLENLLYESMLLTFNTEIEDGSIEQVYIHAYILCLSHFPFLILPNFMFVKVFNLFEVCEILYMFKIDH